MAMSLTGKVIYRHHSDQRRTIAYQTGFISEGTVLEWIDAYILSRQRRVHPVPIDRSLAPH